MSPVPDDFGAPEPIAPAAPALTREEFEKAYAAAQKQVDEANQRNAPTPTGAFVPGVGTVGTGPLAAIGEGVTNPFDVQTKLGAAITAGLGKLAGEGDFGPKYQAELAKGRAKHEAIHEAHPVLNTAAQLAMEAPAFALSPNTLGAQTAVGAGTGALRTAADSQNVLGEGGTTLAGAKEVAGGGLGGGLGANVGFRVFRGLGRALGSRADEAADMAITGGTKTAMRQLDKAYGAIGGTEGMVPGERAAILRASGAVGGLRDRGGTTEGLKSAWGALDEQFGGLIHKADASGVKVPLTSAAANLEEMGSQFLANDAVEPAIAKAMQRLGKVADKQGNVSHGDLQQILKELRPTVSKIYQKASNFRSPGEEAFLSTYSALRRTQDEGLEAAVGEGAREIRQYSALMHRLEELSGRAGEAMRGNDKVGLLGEIQKAKGSGEAAAGLMATLSGHPYAGVPMILKGLFSTGKGMFGRTAAPYKANVLTSLYSGLQRPATALGETVAPAMMGERAGEALGAGIGRVVGAEPAGDEFGPPEPVGGRPAVAKKAK